MTDQSALFSELQPDIQALADPLFEFSEVCIRKRGNFLPHGAVLTEGGDVRLVAAMPDSGSDFTNSTEVLPNLHRALRSDSTRAPLRAVAVAESVTITPQGERSTKAVKVLFEHRRGLTVALYLPFKRKLLRGYSFGNVFCVPAQTEVDPWARGAP